jgi:choline-phosphate cytidylyltransferase/glycerol-3-phosphate cytidylyltransferase
VAISTDSFNAGKGKKAYHSYEARKEMLEAVRYVDLVIPEDSWEQKADDVLEYEVDTVVMGGDWAGSDRFEYLKDYCDVVYLDRTDGVSTSQIKEELGLQPEKDGVNQIPESKNKENK